MQEISVTHRIGFHYFPDTIHYRDTDLDHWLPILKQLGAHWITLVASPTRAIPETFLRSLIEQNINPIVHIKPSFNHPIDSTSIRLLINTYAKWGVQYLALFDRPNIHQSWNGNSWSRANLVERFLDIYLPLALSSLETGLIPVFPPLEPGGDYWDTVFLRTALSSIQRRGYECLSSKLVLSAYAWKHGHPLQWGAGGPDAWSASQPYQTPAGSEDQFGFHIYEWYQSQAVAVLQHCLPIILLGAGCRMQDCVTAQFSSGDPQLHQQYNLEIARQLSLTSPLPDGTQPFPPELLACNFWVLSCDNRHPDSQDAWFPQDRHPLPVAETLLKLNTPSTISDRKHYVLLSPASWDGKDWVYQSVQNLLSRADLILGSSVEEALHANRVTIIGPEKWIDENQFQQLVRGECMIEELYGDGIYLASKLMKL